MTSNIKIKTLMFIFTYWLSFNLLVFHTPFTFFYPPDSDEISRVLFSINTANSLDELNRQEQDWETINLPDDWNKNHNAENTNIHQVWYRANISLLEKDENIWAVYIPSVTHNAAVYVNGIWVGQGGDFSDPVSRHHNEPLLFSFSSKLLKEGDNQIDIRVKATLVEVGLMDQFYFAPKSKLISAYEWKHFIRVDFLQWITTAMFLLSIMVLAFWIARPQEIIFGLFSLELFIWATHNLNLIVSEIPVSNVIWDALKINTLGWTIVTMIFFNHRFIGGGSKLVEKIILCFSILGIGIFFLPDIGSVLGVGHRFWYIFVMIFGIYAIIHVIKRYLATQNNDIFLMILAGIPILVFGLHDILMINNFIDRREGSTIQYSVIPSVILFSFFLIKRFVKSISEAERLAETLEHRVREKQKALQIQFQELAELEKESTLSEERERIMRDVHDGIGGQLLSVLTILQEQTGDVFDNVRDKVKFSLIDLRFVIDSLDPTLDDLPTLLGMMRMRLIDQLESANIELEWAVTDLPEIYNTSPRRNLHIMRIVQEAITNSIKHSGSTKMKLATGVNNNRIYIDVIDYGSKTIIPAKNISRGITNMHYRAGQLDADLNIHHSDNGTSVRLTLNDVF